jgi:hypothetical protein
LQFVQFAIVGDHDAADFGVTTIYIAFDGVCEEGIREGRERLQFGARFFEKRVDLHRGAFENKVGLGLSEQCFVCHRSGKYKRSNNVRSPVSVCCAH